VLPAPSLEPTLFVTTLYGVEFRNPLLPQNLRSSIPFRWFTSESSLQRTPFRFLISKSALVTKGNTECRERLGGHSINVFKSTHRRKSSKNARGWFFTIRPE